MAPPLIAAYDKYWRLETYDDMPDHTLHNKLRTKLRAKGLDFRIMVSRGELIEAMHRFDRGLLPYGHKRITDKDLRHFINSRRLTKPTASSRQAMISVLTGADETRVFGRFMDLPPELRQRIYQMHIGSFPERLFCPTQPPIARASRLLRREALPVFHELTTFELRLVFGTDGYKTGDDISGDSLRPCLLTSQFLQSMHAHSTGVVRLRSSRIHVRALSRKDMLHVEGKHIVVFSCHDKHATKRRKMRVDECPKMNEPVISAVKRHIDLQLPDRNSFKEAGFSIAYIYRLRTIIEAAFFETWPKYGGWAR